MEVKLSNPVAIIQFTSREDWMAACTPEKLKELAETQAPFNYDTIQCIGTVSGKDIFQIRFIKYINYEQGKSSEETDPH